MLYHLSLKAQTRGRDVKIYIPASGLYFQAMSVEQIEKHCSVTYSRNCSDFAFS